MHVDAVKYHLGILVTLVCLDRGFHVPLHDLAVEEEGGVGVTLVVETGVQRPEADLGFGDHGVAGVGQAAIEPLQYQGMLDDRGRRRKLARTSVVLAVRADVHAGGILRDRHIARQRGFGVLVGRLGAVDDGHLGYGDVQHLACLHGLIDAGKDEEQAVVHFRRHHVLVMEPHLGVVLVGRGKLAGIGTGHQVAVAVDQHLPAHLHGIGGDAGKFRFVLAAVLQVAPVVGQRNRELAAAEHAGGVVDVGVDRVALVGEGAVKALDIGQLGDLVGLHGVHADARETAVDLVVHEQVLAVVGAVGIGRVDVVRVAGGVLGRAVGLGAEDRLRFVGHAPTDQGVHVVDRDALQLAPGRDAIDAAFARMPAAGKRIVFVELSRRDFVFAVIDTASGLGRGGARASAFTRRRRRFLVTCRQAQRKPCAGKSDLGGGFLVFSVSLFGLGVGLFAFVLRL